MKWKNGEHCKAIGASNRAIAWPTSLRGTPYANTIVKSCCKASNFTSHWLASPRQYVESRWEIAPESRTLRYVFYQPDATTIIQYTTEWLEEDSPSEWIDRRALHAHQAFPKSYVITRKHPATVIISSEQEQTRLIGLFSRRRHLFATLLPKWKSLFSRNFSLYIYIYIIYKICWN